MPPLLEGIRVVEWSVYVMGPLAGVMLSDLGADVIKIEDPKSGGEILRGLRFTSGTVDAAMPGGRNAAFEAMNWNKRSIGLDLKTSEGRELAYQLVEQADIFLTNYQPTVIERLEMDYETLRQRNPRLIYAQGSAFGEQGPDRDRPGNDYTGQARSGMMWGPGTDADPPPLPHGRPLRHRRRDPALPRHHHCPAGARAERRGAEDRRVQPRGRNVVPILGGRHHLADAE